MTLSSSEKETLLGLVGELGEVRFSEPMSAHTTLRVGGPVDAWIAPNTIDVAAAVRRFCTQTHIPCRAVGAGSNLLVLDEGVSGVLLSTQRLRGLHFLDEIDNKTPVCVEAGVSTGKLLAEAMRRGLGGVEFLGGVPGSIGGGLMMNAGTFVGEFRDVVSEVLTLNESGETVFRTHAACGFVYRGSAIPKTDIVVKARLLLSARPRADMEAAVAALRMRRKEREPHGVGCAGSFFKNPPGDFAGRLIEACGLKGVRHGGAEISPVHANWFVNVGDAKAADFLSLIERAKTDVKARFGIGLDLEVKILGENEISSSQMPNIQD